MEIDKQSLKTNIQFMIENCPSNIGLQDSEKIELNSNKIECKRSCIECWARALKIFNIDK